jgi:3'-5' exoribonuclease
VEFINTRDLKGIDENGRMFVGVFLLRGVSMRRAKNGKSFLSVEVGDRFGTFSFTIFEESSSFTMLQNTSPGLCLEICGVTEMFNERFSPRINGVRRVSPAEIKSLEIENQLYDGPKESPEELRKELDSQVRSISHEKLRKTVEYALQDTGNVFFENTAAISMHHAYRYGLLEHSVHVTRTGIALLPFYPQVDHDLAVAGMILHDIGKSLEYEGDGVYQRSAVGNLQGHVVLGYRIVRKAALAVALEDDLTLRLEHIILCHQGMLEYGAAVLPSSPEGVFVALLDNFDARMAMVEHALDNTSSKHDFSEKIPGLENARVFTRKK